MITHEHLHVDYPIEILDEETGDSLVFTTHELFVAFEEAEAAEVEPVDEELFFRRAMNMKDQLLTMAGEMELLLGGRVQHGQ